MLKGRHLAQTLALNHDPAGLSKDGQADKPWILSGADGHVQLHVPVLRCFFSTSDAHQPLLRMFCRLQCLQR